MGHSVAEKQLNIESWDSDFKSWEEKKKIKKLKVEQHQHVGGRWNMRAMRLLLSNLCAWLLPVSIHTILEAQLLKEKKKKSSTGVC